MSAFVSAFVVIINHYISSDYKIFKGYRVRIEVRFSVRNLNIYFTLSFFGAFELMRGYVVRAHLPKIGNSFALIALTREKGR